MIKIEYESISRLEAMAMIDEGKTEELYFVYPMGLTRPVSNSFSEPIKYITGIHKKIFFFFKKDLSIVPGNEKHYWLRKKVTTDLFDAPRPPVKKN